MSDIPAQYIHPTTKQCNYAPDLSATISGVPFSANVTCSQQSFSTNGVANEITLLGTPSFTGTNFFYISNSSAFNITLTLNGSMSWVALTLYVVFGSQYNDGYLHRASKLIFSTSQSWVEGTQTWTIDAQDLIVTLKKAILYESYGPTIPVKCFFVYGGNVRGSAFTIHSVSWTFSGVRFNY